jgi:hypothetical protein
MICEKCAPRELEAMRALESLTPSGSEFVNDIKRCVKFVRWSQSSRMAHIIKMTLRVRELEMQVSSLQRELDDITASEHWENHEMGQ